MSYPLTIRPLIIEDNPEVKEAYTKIFAGISKQSPWSLLTPIEPCFALSYEDGMDQLAKSIAFHLIILDLELPEKAGKPAQHGLDFGIRLLDACLNRENFPVPGVLVISAHIDKTEQTKLQDKVGAGCFYGKMLAKGTYDALKNEISEACNRILLYSSIGIHMRDTFGASYPSISPREEDLLRRSALALEDVVGLDLSWWSAERFGDTDSDAAWTKVLLGRYVLAQGHGASNPRFFKLYPSANRDSVVQSARQAEHHLRHIRVIGEKWSPSRALLVTENAIGSSERPISLAEFLSSSRKSQPSVESVVRQIFHQLNGMGISTPDAQHVKDLLWKYHDLERLALHVQRCPTGDWVHELFEDAPEPEALLEELQKSKEIIHCSLRTLVHGDLHLTNVALTNDQQAPKAFVFDTASLVGPSPIERDLACLEISALLHQYVEPEEFKRICGRWYKEFNGSRDIEFRSDVSANLNSLVGSLRSLVGEGLNRRLYALFLFDFAAIQVSGLAYGSSDSKVENPYAAAMLVRATAQLYWKEASASLASVGADAVIESGQEVLDKGEIKGMRSEAKSDKPAV